MSRLAVRGTLGVGALLLGSGHAGDCRKRCADRHPTLAQRFAELRGMALVPDDLAPLAA
jgi:hypothetical protein